MSQILYPHQEFRRICVYPVTRPDFLSVEVHSDKKYIVRIPFWTHTHIPLLVSCDVVATEELAVFGNPLAVKIRVHPPQIFSGPPIHLRYEVGHLGDCWLISGTPIGVITLEKNIAFECDFVLFPVRTGLLSLPMVKFTQLGTDEIIIFNVKSIPSVIHVTPIQTLLKTFVLDDTDTVIHSSFCIEQISR